MPLYLHQFFTPYGNVSKGQSFILGFEKAGYLLSCYHLFTRAAGLKRSVDPNKIAEEITGYRLHDPQSDELVIEGPGPYPIENVKPFDVQPEDSNAIDATSDIVVFPVNNYDRLQHFCLSQNQAAIGQQVHVHYIKKSLKTHCDSLRGVVVDYKLRFMMIALDPSLSIGGISGAAVCDESGKVLGMVVAGLRETGGRELIIASPTHALRQILS